MHVLTLEIMASRAQARHQSATARKQDGPRARCRDDELVLRAGALRCGVERERVAGARKQGGRASAVLRAPHAQLQAVAAGLGGIYMTGGEGVNEYTKHTRLGQY